MPVDRLVHVGICVSDLERSLRFYRDALGFEDRSELVLEDDRTTQRLLEIPGCWLTARYLERDGYRIELLYYPQPGTVGEPDPRPMNQLGLTHLALRVSGLEALLERVEAAGGRVLKQSRSSNPKMQAEVVFVTDPDGTRIELVESPGDPAVLLGTPVGDSA